MIPGLPYTQLALGAGALLGLLVLCWACYRWGRSAERAKALQGVLEAERRINRAVELARADPVRVDTDWLKGSQAGSPPTPKAPPP